MTCKNDTAFPIFSGSGYVRESEEGLTKREHFAGLAMQGILSNPDGLKDIRRQSGDDWDEYNRLVAGFCTLMADALIESLNKAAK